MGIVKKFAEGDRWLRYNIHDRFSCYKAARRMAQECDMPLLAALNHALALELQYSRVKRHAAFIDNPEADKILRRKLAERWQAVADVTIGEIGESNIGRQELDQHGLEVIKAMNGFANLRVTEETVKQ